MLNSTARSIAATRMIPAVNRSDHSKLMLTAPLVSEVHRSLKYSVISFILILALGMANNLIRFAGQPLGNG